MTVWVQRKWYQPDDEDRTCALNFYIGCAFLIIALAIALVCCACVYDPVLSPATYPDAPSGEGEAPNLVNRPDRAPTPTGPGPSE